MLPFIDLKTPYLRSKDRIDGAIQRVLDHGRFIMGPEIAELERTLADYVGVPHCITVASGTDSLEIILRALAIGPGDEVITVPFTWISTAEVMELVGATTRFVDIDYDTFNIAIDQIEPAITPKTKAIMPVSLFGQMPDLEAINAIAAKHGLAVIEDAAQSFGATRNGERSCGATIVSSTSFFPAKPFGCYGDGGAIFTKDDAMAEKMRAIRTHGGIRRHEHTLVGMNGRFDTLQAAILLAKWPDFQNEVEARARIGARYSELLQSTLRHPPSAIHHSGEAGALQPPIIAEGNTHVYAQYTIRVPDRDTLGAKLKEQGIPTAVYYPVCLHEQPVFAHLGYKPGDFPVAEQVAKEVISLPMHPYLDDSTQDQITQAILAAV